MDLDASHHAAANIHQESDPRGNIERARRGKAAEAGERAWRYVLLGVRRRNFEGIGYDGGLRPAPAASSPLKFQKANMHIPDGYLSPSTCAVLYAAAAPFWYIALQRVKKVSDHAPGALALGYGGAFLL